MADFNLFNLFMVWVVFRKLYLSKTYFR